MKTIMTILIVGLSVSLAFASGEVPWPKPTPTNTQDGKQDAKTASMEFDVRAQILTFWEDRGHTGFLDDGFAYSFDKYKDRECARNNQPCKVDAEDLTHTRVCYSGSVNTVCSALGKEFRKNMEEYSSGAHALNELVSCTMEGEQVRLAYTMITDYDEGTLLAERLLETCPGK